MNDAEARALLEGIDGPRPLPPELADALFAGLAAVDAPRPVPDDLRRRLEATMLAGSAPPLPRRVRRALTGDSRVSALRRVVGVAAAALVVVAAVAVGARDDGAAKLAVGGEVTPAATDAAGTATGSSGATGGSAVAGTAAGGGSTSGGDAPAPSASSAGASADAGSTASPDAGTIEIGVIGTGTDVARGFDAFVRFTNARGGIAGRPVATVEPGGAAVATVNLGTEPLDPLPTGVVFETAFVDEERLRGPVTSLASPSTRQAELAVDEAFASPAVGATAVVYVSESAPWTAVADAMEMSLRLRGVVATRVAFDPERPSQPDADAAFLALSPDDLRRWLPGAADPPRGAWAVGSAWDEELAAEAVDAGVTVLSPYRPASEAEREVLTLQLDGAPLTVAVVHGWVTAKALVHLLERDAGPLTESDLDALAGWESGWAPPFETRPVTRARTPDAIVLVPGRTGFTARGDFRRA